jgi:hypothetical protein
MRRLFTANLAVVILLLTGQSAQADPIQLLSYEGGVATSVGGLGLPVYMPLHLNYSSQGGSIEFIGGALTPTPSNGWTAYADQPYPVDAQFFLNLGAPAPGSTDAFAGPVLEISGQVTGLLTGPGYAGQAWRWSGSYDGTATSASLDRFNSQDVSQLPAPLLDILNHPEHFHFSVYVGGGDQNTLNVTLTFDAPSPIELPEPTALVTLVAGSAAMIVRRRMRRVATGANPRSTPSASLRL